MSAVRLLLLPTVFCALLAPSAALAATSYWTTVPALHLRLPLTLGSARTAGARNRTCQAQGNERKGLARRSALIGDPRRTAVVACEQPPRSQLQPSSLETGAVAAAG